MLLKRSVPRFPQDAENRVEGGIQLIGTNVTLDQVSHDMMRNQQSFHLNEMIYENKKPGLSMDSTGSFEA